MAIGIVKGKPGFYQVIDDKGRILCSISDPGTLVGYTSSTVSIKECGVIRMYDEKGHYKGSTSA